MLEKDRLKATKNLKDLKVEKLNEKADYPN